MSAPNAIQDAIAAKIRLIPWFAAPTAIGVYTQDEGDLSGKITNSLSSLTGGLAILVLCPMGDNPHPESARVALVSLVSVQCIEIPLICRGTGGLNKTAYQAAQRLCSPSRSASQGLHLWNPQVSGCGTLACDGYSSDSDPEEGTLIYAARFKFTETLD